LQRWDEKKIVIGENYQTASFIFKSKPSGNSWNKAMNDNVEFIDRDKIDGKIVLRHWQSGDKFRPVNFGHTKKLSDLFINEKIGKFRKHYLPILIDDNNIIWVCGLRLSDRYKIDKNTSNIVKMEYYER
ncbi:MAG TPA: tRNA lysidine(34) synthetase TilS, partial [bacterium]|nr:tRNA lysidine(34) synthetase TilS [bacterium]